MQLLWGYLRAAVAEAGRVRDKDEDAWHGNNVAAKGLASGAVSKSMAMARSVGKEESMRRRWRLRTR